MSDVAAVLHCPKCRTPGREIKKEDRLLRLACPECGIHWNTLALVPKVTESIVH
ncbi:hypothetical protein [Paenibacillus naphthalenovorans]|uniref:hypothetical protein n=1 Tax=Paenibacillus naphthalenovorans TaxID=162209 RepID=UPI003D2D8E67